MSGLTRVNQRLASDKSASAQQSPSPVLYPPSHSVSGRSTPAGYARHRPTSPSPLANRPRSAQSQYAESPYGGGMSSGMGMGGPGSGLGLGMGVGGSSGYGSGRMGTAYELEQHNDDRLSGLLSKVKVLKDITTGIGNETREGNLELAGMNDTFGSTSNKLSGTFKRMTKMARRQGGMWCWVMGFVIVVVWIFLVMWWFRR